MNFCIFCGLEMPKDAKYCQMCGKRQPKNNNDQQEVQESEDKKSLLESPQKLIVIGIGAFIVLIAIITGIMMLLLKKCLIFLSRNRECNSPFPAYSLSSSSPQSM